MLLVCGIVPQERASLIIGEARFDEGRLFVDDQEIPCSQGTAALVSAACVTAAFIKRPAPRVVLAGDRGNGRGSRILYDYLIHNIKNINPDVLLMHYIIPVMGLMKKVCAATAACSKKTAMIADASSMYAAKAAGLASDFDIFTPDLCEMAFLADDAAVHPAYISRHLFNAEITRIQELIDKAYRHKNAARTLIVKGSTDHVVEDGKIIHTILTPNIEALEAIGGTGDTVSGMLGAFVDAGMAHKEAAITALKMNRRAGEYIKATPATKIRDIVVAISRILNNDKSLNSRKG